MLQPPMAHNYNISVDTSLEKVKRHPKYYLSGGDIHFLVENYLFRVHRYFFERESAFFREKFAVAAPPGQQPKGSTDAHAFPLEDVLANDFARFLWVFYNPKYSIYDATVEDWSAILKLAFDWRFAEVKKLCVRELEKFEIPALRKIELYQAYELDKKLLIPSYIAMCMRPEPLSIKEGRQLGLETALLLATARESARGRPSGSPGQLCSSPVTAGGEDMVSIIKDVFGITAGPPSPSLTPLENIGSASAFTIPAMNGMNRTFTTPKKPTLAAPSHSAATTAVDSTFGPSSTPTVTAAKDAAKSPGQFASNSSPTILSGRLNSVFAPMQGTVHPPPLEPPPRAPSPAVQTPTVETPVVETPSAPTPVVETPVLEMPLVEKDEPEKPGKAPTKKENQKRKRQQEKKAAQKKGAQLPMATGGTQGRKEA
ncbi:uncharacterized protein B0H18DRAFT_96695 [Fomitopsis serialis]|uniref:uncharacterized protein n=1 Tax=Fomitopsis serialis TaxID=139415 RepID=UPI002008C6AA|nr:uncharacterized protein B0H18DRAFT_96695 [Neoantrodia serialis]KAH9915391.1 hypothetical protein B0H18DRAFT_96695 [Neoantrodia serialis]